MLCVISRNSNRSFENECPDDVIDLKTISCAFWYETTRQEPLVHLASLEHGIFLGVNLSNVNPITKSNVGLIEMTLSGRSSLQTAVPQNTAGGGSFFFSIRRVSRKTEAERMRISPVPQRRPLERPG